MKHQFENKKDRKNVIVIPSYSNAPLMPNFPAEIDRVKNLKKIGLCIYIQAALVNATVEVTNTINNQAIGCKKGANTYSFWVSIDNQDKIVVNVILSHTGDEVRSIYCSDLVTNIVKSPKTVEDLMDYLFMVFERYLKQEDAA